MSTGKPNPAVTTDTLSLGDVYRKYETSMPKSGDKEIETILMAHGHAAFLAGMRDMIHLIGEVVDEAKARKIDPFEHFMNVNDFIWARQFDGERKRLALEALGVLLGASVVQIEEVAAEAPKAAPSFFVPIAGKA